MTTTTTTTRCDCAVCAALRGLTLEEAVYEGDDILLRLPESVRRVLLAQSRVRAGTGSPDDVRVIQEAADCCTGERLGDV